MRADAGLDQIRALVLANARFWTSVAPAARSELAHWRTEASRIEDPALRELALGKLTDEAFNAEVAATLATLAPRAHRDSAVRSIVALEVLFDYLDGRTEQLFSARSELDGDAALQEGRELYGAMSAVISGQVAPLRGADGNYLESLSEHAHEGAASLPGLAAAAPFALRAASRCAEAQLRLHACGALGNAQLEQWAEHAAEDSGLGWREYTGGCASSVLAMHALIAAAARPRLSGEEARAIDDTYLSIGAVITTLDSLVDDAGDKAAGEPGYIRLYEDRQEIQGRLTATIEQALQRSARLSQGAHHAMTLAGVAAYYTTHPGAADPENRAIRTAVRRALAPTIWPALAVLHGWRAAKHARSSLAQAQAPETDRGNRRTNRGSGVR